MNNKNNSNVYQYSYQSDYFIKSSEPYVYSKVEESDESGYMDKAIDDTYYKKAVLQKKVIAHVTE